MLAIRNGPGHVVFGSADEHLLAAQEEAERRGAIRTIKLAVTTPSHTPWLAAASSAFQQLLAPWSSPARLAFPVLCAIDGRAAYR